MAKRIQMRRTKGWRKPDGVIYVGRPTVWGNPFRVGLLFLSATPREHVRLVEDVAAKMGILRHDHILTVEESVALYRVIAEREFRLFRNYGGAMGWNGDDLRGRDLACWCAIDKPCHADVLLELANR